MSPLFDRNMLHVGWLDGDHVFDRDIVWRAFVCGDHLFCAVSNEWRGSRHGSALLDTTGLIVAVGSPTPNLGVNRMWRRHSLSRRCRPPAGRTRMAAVAESATAAN